MVTSRRHTVENVGYALVLHQRKNVTSGMGRYCHTGKENEEIHVCFCPSEGIVSSLLSHTEHKALWKYVREQECVTSAHGGCPKRPCSVQGGPSNLAEHN
jgi:hypothetical protein